MIKSAVKRFCTDKNGNIVLFQSPNIPLTVWVVCTLFVFFFKDYKVSSGISFVGSAFLLTWAYLEITTGANPFRRLLGAVVLVAIIVSHLA